MKRWMFTFGALAVAAAISGRPAAAQTVPRDQVDADITTLANRGESLLVWSEDRGAGHRIFGKRIRSNGIPIGGANGGEWEVAGSAAPAGANGDQRWPAVEDGLIVWSEKLPGATDYDLYAQRLFDNGRSYGPPTLIAGGPGDQKYADVIGSTNNEWLVVWSEDANDGGDVMGRRISTALTPRSAVFPVAQGPGVAEDPVIARDPSDQKFFIVFFTDDRNGNKDIYGTRLAETGLPRGGSRGGQFPVIQSPLDDYAPAVAFTSGSSGRASNAANQDTRNLLMWTTDTVADGPDVMGQRIRSNGYPVGKSFTIAGGPGAQGWPAVTLESAAGDGALSIAGGSDQPDWLAVWDADIGGSQDILGVDVRQNGIPRPTIRVLAAD